MCLNSGGNDNGQFFFKKILEGGKMTEGITVIKFAKLLWLLIRFYELKSKFLKLWRLLLTYYTTPSLFYIIYLNDGRNFLA